MLSGVNTQRPRSRDNPLPHSIENSEEPIQAPFISDPEKGVSKTTLVNAILLIREVIVWFDQREVAYDYGELDEVSLAYAITIHKAQGSEFPAVVIPLATQHYLLLQRNLIYTGITRGRKLVVLIGQRKLRLLSC